MRTPGRYKVTPGDIAILPEAALADYSEVVWFDVEGNSTDDLILAVEVRILFRAENGAVVASVYGSPPGRGPLAA